MATPQHKLYIELCLDTVWHADPPHVIVTFDDQVHWQGTLDSNRVFVISTQREPGPARLSVEMTNKVDGDTVPAQNLDKAVIVRSVAFNHIQDPRFVWQAVYRPRYPEHMLKQCPSLELPAHTYLSWNGPWTLEIDVPIFTWIHRVRSLGWIYP